LQSLEDDNLSFIALPIDIDNKIIDRNDLEEGCSDLGFAEKDLALLLIVSVHRDVDQVRLSANARAPIFMDSKSRKAEQYVLRNNKYVVRHMITA
jgi:flagellar assembly factor FliW